MYVITFYITFYKTYNNIPNVHEKKKYRPATTQKKPLMYVCLIDVKNPSKNRVENQMEYPLVCPYVCMTGRVIQGRGGWT